MQINTNKIILTAIIIIFYSCSNNIKTEKKLDLLNARTHDPIFFNSNNVLIQNTVNLIHKNDTIDFYTYDTLGRFVKYSMRKGFKRKEHLWYFNKSNILIAKFLQVDYSMDFNSSLIQNNDTLFSYWFDSFGIIEDTFSYVFENNKIKELISSPLMDYDKIKTKKMFFYNDSALTKIITLPIWGEYLVYGKLDSITTYYNYKEKLVNEITEKFYFKSKNKNYTNKYFFDEKGYPTKFIEKDTIEYKISIK